MECVKPEMLLFDISLAAILENGVRNISPYLQMST